MGAIGLSIAEGNGAGRAPVVCVAGDGGWAYSMGEVETAARMRLPVVAVILNNSSLAWTKQHASDRFPGRIVSQDFIDVRYSDAARALGAEAAYVDSLDELAEVFGKAVADESGRPWVIEVKSCGIESPVLVRAGGY
jgi:acetolactate synthase-1/2/3 large subunit